jgi:hypothetical protein
MRMQRRGVQPRGFVIPAPEEIVRGIVGGEILIYALGGILGLGVAGDQLRDA